MVGNSRNNHCKTYISDIMDICKDSFTGLYAIKLDCIFSLARTS